MRDRRGATLVYGVLALASIVSVWPILASHSIPAFQQDWAWPLSRPLAWEWLKTFLGLWDGRSTAHANLLPWQTYAVAVQVGFIALFGASAGLAIWIAALEFLAGFGCIAMLNAFNVTSWPARAAAACFFAFSPVVLTRVAAGHLAYLLGYALLPLVVALARRTIERRDAMAAIALGIAIGIAGSQIQYLAIAWLAIAPLPFAVPRAAGWGRRLSGAAAIAVAVQLQSLLPLAFGSAAAQYAMQPALLSFEYNNSAPLRDAPVMLGYFTRYYETHAPGTAAIALYGLLAVALALALFSGRRSGGVAIAFVAIGATLTAGLYGPLSAALGWSFEHVSYAAAFRDLHYFAALTALGIALSIGVGLQRLPPSIAVGVLVLVGWIALPVVQASELRDLLVPRDYVADALADMQAATAAGPGRVLWLPAEEPLGLIGAANAGRDFTAYGPGSNPSVSDDYQNPQLAYALATLRYGKPDWNAFAQLNLRYLAVRTYVRSERRYAFGVAFPMAFGGLDDAAIARLLARSRAVRRIRQSPLSTLYEFGGNDGFTYPASANENAMLYSELRAREVAVDDEERRLPLRTSRASADPRLGWVDGTLGWRYAPWLPDSVYPFAWTLSRVPLSVRNAGGCVLAGAVPRGARVRNGDATLVVRGEWKRYALGGLAPTASILPSAGDVTAIARRSCATAPPPHAAFVFAGGYDAGWRAVDGWRWVAPHLANGWMMAWDARASAQRLVYVTAFLQLAGVLIMVFVLGLALFWNAARPAQKG